MSQPATSGAERNSAWPSFRTLLILLGVLMLVIFRQSFEDGYTLFSNDGPLAAISSEKASVPAAFSGLWEDLNSLGFAGISAAPNITVGLACALKPLFFSKFYAPICLFLLGLSAWLFCRQLGFSSITCILVGLAAALNMNVFSNACWGLATRALTLGSVFCALAALHSAMKSRPIVKCILAGMAVGMAVMEGFDVGAIFSIYVAAFAYFLVLNREGESIGARVVKGAGLVALVAVFAAFIAAYTLDVLIKTQIKGIAGTSQDQQTMEERYGFATQWSLPKIETLRVIIPGVFGYRMTDQNEQYYPGCYWGTVGQQPNYEKTGGLARHSGSGEYAGILVVLLALWAVFQSLREKQSPYTPFERRCIWIWTLFAFVSLVLAWGRHTPFYRLFYALPYASTIRNPIKFMHIFHLIVLILFAYGLQDVVRRYLENAKEKTASMFEQINAWWRTATSFEKKWTTGCLVAIAGSLLGWLIYASSRKELKAYLMKVGFGDENLAASIAGLSLMEVGWYVLFLILSVLFLTCILSGAFAGRRAKIAAAMLGLLLVVDMWRADSNWIIYENYKVKLAPNPIIDALRERPADYRVTAHIPFSQQQQFYQFYHVLWLQHHFQYYNIQSLDLAQMRSPPEDLMAFEGAFSSPLLMPRHLELTSTRYLLGLNGMVEPLNDQIDKAQHRFRGLTPFDLSQNPTNGMVAVTTNSPTPHCMLMEFTGALPRAKLYASWQTAGGNEALGILANPSFDPAQTVLVAENIPAPKPEQATNANPGKVETTEYSSRHRKLSAQVDVPSVLLLNDRLAPDWNLWVDGKPEKILRCNFLMRGVQLSPGKHEILFRYQPPTTFLKISFAAIGLCLLLCGYVAFATPRPAPVSMSATPPSPAAPPNPAPAAAPEPKKARK